MEERRKAETATPWAATVGYSRAVRAGNTIHVSGTAAVAEDGTIQHAGDPYRQAQRCLEIIVAALRSLGGDVEHVVRTRMYVRHHADWHEVGRAHGELFGTVKPATTMIVTSFIDDAMLVEIEAEAIL
jgi:enamine deaminase RidA (YjgF/YER057c/UK114 family)